ncbi:MAG TPA: hypothetical protein VHU91_06695 [Mycobacteriales bacterium]|jgi:hypothetical protein|nr:hypothetical protein [Mycobacteriales bacterium]
MFTLLVVLLVIWLVFIILGAVIKGLLWLAVIGVLLFVITGIVGFVKRELFSKTSR